MPLPLLALKSSHLVVGHAGLHWLPLPLPLAGASLPHLLSSGNRWQGWLSNADRRLTCEAALCAKRVLLRCPAPASVAAARIWQVYADDAHKTASCVWWIFGIDFYRCLVSFASHAVYSQKRVCESALIHATSTHLLERY